MDQCYFNGDFWQCVTDTNAGESPATNPEKWSKISLPREWRRVLGELTYGHLLESDGQTDKARVKLAEARTELEELVRKEANKEGRLSRPEVGR